MANRTARARGLINPQGVFLPESFLEEAFRGEYDGSNNLIYAGFARPGSPESLPVWQISKLTYSGANLTSITWPTSSEGAVSNDYEFAWSLRATYTYV
jgi:hypothetical protein